MGQTEQLTLWVDECHLSIGCPMLQADLLAPSQGHTQSEEKTRKMMRMKMAPKGFLSGPRSQDPGSACGWASSGISCLASRKEREGVGRSALPISWSPIPGLPGLYTSWPEFQTSPWAEQAPLQLWCRPSHCHEGIWGGGRAGDIH